jgi:hypothetical protein
VAFVAGVQMGGAKSAERSTEIRLVVPDQMTVRHEGIPSDRAACLEWVSKHFEANIGQYALVCSGANIFGK